MANFIFQIHCFELVCVIDADSGCINRMNNNSKKYSTSSARRERHYVKRFYEKWHGSKKFQWFLRDCCWLVRRRLSSKNAPFIYVFRLSLEFQLNQNMKQKNPFLRGQKPKPDQNQNVRKIENFLWPGKINSFAS